MRFAQFFCTAVLCGVLVTPAVAADEAKAKAKVKTKAAGSAVDVTGLHDVLEDDKALNSFFGKTFGVIRGLVATDADAAEKLINALEAEIKKAKPKNPKSVALIPRATAAISNYRNRIALSRVKIKDLEASLKKNSNQSKAIQQYGQKVAQEVSGLARSQPDKAEAKQKAAVAFLNGLVLDESDTAALKAITTAKAALKRYDRTIASARKLLSLNGQDIAPLQVDGWVNGSPLTDADLKGKVVVLDFWAVWCGPCIRTFPHLIEWQAKYGKKDFVMIGLTRYYKRYSFNDQTGQLGKAQTPQTPEDERALVQRFADFHKLTHRLAIQPTDSTLSKYYGVSGIPHVTVIDKKGKIRMTRVGSGAANAKALEELIEKLLAE